MKANFKLVISLICLILILSAVFVFAGNISNEDEPTPTFYTITDIYNLIHNIDTASEGNHSLSPDVEATATSSYSISQIYADLANLIKRENVATSTVYLGVTGDYGNPDPAYATTTFTASSLTPITGETYSLDDIYHLVVDDVIASPHERALSPGGEPAESMHSLSEIYIALADLGEAKAPYVNSDITYLGQQGGIVSDGQFWTGLIGYWPLDETEGMTVTDYSGNGNDGENMAPGTSTDDGLEGATINQPGKVGQSYYFNGATSTEGDSYVHSGNYLRFDSFTFPFGNVPKTICGWILSEETGAFREAFGAGTGDNGQGFGIGISDENQLTFWGGYEGGISKNAEDYGGVEIDYPLTNNTWYYVCSAWNGTVNKLYSNGELIGENSFPLDTNSSYPFLIGKSSAVVPDGNFVRDFWRGNVDEVAVWDRALSQNDIQSLYNNGSGMSLMPD